MREDPVELLAGVRVGLEPADGQMLAAADRVASGATDQGLRPIPT